jgi:hypothetical protein
VVDVGNEQFWYEFTDYGLPQKSVEDVTPEEWARMFGQEDI